MHPFSGETEDGCVWGRGAVDMKDMDAMMLAVVRQRLREGRRPPRDVVLAFVADEEAGGTWGARWLVDNHPELFEGVTEAIGEVGGFSATIGGRRLYLIQTAEKGMAWMRLTARGTAGHGSMLQPDNAVTELAEAVARIGRHEWPVRLTPAVRAFLGRGRRGARHRVRIADDYRDLLAKLGPISRMVGATLTNTANPTVLSAGYKVNVVPQVATAQVDGQVPARPRGGVLRRGGRAARPGRAARVHAHDIAAGDDVRRRPVPTAMTAALLAEDPDARVVPYCLSGGTDAKSFSRLGIRCFGFTPAAAAGRSGLSPACSTAWTSGSRSTRCASASASWTGFSIFASSLSQVRTLTSQPWCSDEEPVSVNYRLRTFSSAMVTHCVRPLYPGRAPST